MDLTEAARRVLFHHARIIVACALLGAVAGIAIATVNGPRYTASTRVVLDARIPETAETVTAVADSARAIVTSRDFVEGALRDAGASRDPALVVRESLRVQSLGTSGAVVIAVTDADRSVAADLANALARELIERWPEASGQSTDVVAVLQQRIDTIDAEIDQLDERIARLNVRLAASDEAPDPIVTARRDAQASERDELAQLRLVLQTQMGSILVEQVSGTEPRIIDHAVPPPDPNPTNVLPITALGALLGLLVGIGMASVIEAVRPTLVGSDSIADELDVPVLGRLPKKPESAPGDNQRLALQVRLAAETAKAHTVELVSLEPSAELRRLQDAVSSSEDHGREGRPRELVVRPFGSARPSVNGNSNGNRSSALVAVVPHVIKRSRLREVRDLQSVTRWPLIGIVTYHPKRRWRRPRLRLRSRTALQ